MSSLKPTRGRAEDTGGSNTQTQNVLTAKFLAWDERSLLCVLVTVCCEPSGALPTSWISGVLLGKPSHDGTSDSAGMSVWGDFTLRGNSVFLKPDGALHPFTKAGYRSLFSLSS